MTTPQESIEVYSRRARRFVGILGLLFVALFTIITLLTKPNGANGVIPGHELPPFAVPLALGTLSGEAPARDWVSLRA
jgi:hypothetical protein